VNNAAQVVGDITEHSVVLRGGIAEMTGQCHTDLPPPYERHELSLQFPFNFFYLFDCIERSKQQSVLLCEGVGEMLSRGRHTCVTLKSAIDGALVTLLGKTTDSSTLRFISFYLDRLLPFQTFQYISPLIPWATLL
jgi:hypothetical protein